MNYNLTLVKNELTKELSYIGKDKFTGLENLTVERFDSTAYTATSDFLNSLRKMYLTRFNKADDYKDQIIQHLISTPESKKIFDQLKSQYYNESIAELVKNQNEAHRIIEQDGKLIRKITPIYMTPHPDGLFDFRDQFYVPEKHFMGRHFDTLYFNIAIIWVMSLGLIFTLYFDILRKIVNAFGTLSK